MLRSPNATVSASNAPSANGSRIASATTSRSSRPAARARWSIGRQKSAPTIRRLRARPREARRQHAAARRQVQQPPRLPAPHDRRRPPPPEEIQPAAEQRVDHIVTPGDAREHALHLGGRFHRAGPDREIVFQRRWCFLVRRISAVAEN